MQLGFMSTLTLIFIVLKLTNVISWSWWYVLLPMLLPFFIYVGVIIGMTVFTIYVWLKHDVFNAE